MIHSAAPSLSSSIALAVGIPAVAGDGGAGSGDFAALLGSTLDAGQDGVTGATMPEGGKTDGNLGGKTLPLDLSFAASTASARTPHGAAKQIVLPDLVIPIDPQQTDAPTTDETPIVVSLARNLGGLTRRAMPAEEPAVMVADPEAPAAPKGDGTPAINGASTDGAVPVQAVQLAAIAVPVSIQPAASTQVIAGPERRDAKVAVASPAHPDRTLTVAVAAAGALVQAATKDEKPKAVGTQALPRATDPATAKSMADSDEPSSPKETSVRASVGGTRVAIPAASDKAAAVEAARDTSVAIVPSAPPAVQAVQAVQAQLTAQHAATSKEAGHDSRKADSAARLETDAEAPEVASTVNRTASPDNLAKPTRTPTAAPTPQPIAGLDAQAFVQSTSPVTVTAPAAPASAPIGHDFVALVDRLVEAREAAMPQVVHAAIRHGEFGQISLRFDQDASGLSVSMNSADPEFASAVQASAASGQSQTAIDNGSNAPRQDTRADTLTQNQTNGQTNGSPSGQSQGSARNDRSGQPPSETRSGRGTASQEPQADQAADTRGGIYA